MKLLFVAFVLLFLASCEKSSSAPEGKGIKNISSGFFDTLSIKQNSSQQGWDSSTSEILYENMKDPVLVPLFNTDLKQEDLSILKCTNFNSLNNDEKSIFYIVFLAAIAKLESDFDSNNMTYDLVHKNWNVGLLQIDRGSAIRHAPEIVNQRISDNELKESNRNLYIGLYILKNQVSGKYKNGIMGELLPNKAYYWQVLNSSFRARFLKAYFNNYNYLTFCEA
jgi:hypothetical protein